MTRAAKAFVVAAAVVACPCLFLSAWAPASSPLPPADIQRNNSSSPRLRDGHQDNNVTSQRFPHGHQSNSSVSRNRNNVTLINVISNHKKCDWEEEFIVDLISPLDYVHENATLSDISDSDDPNGLLDRTIGRYERPVFLVSSHFLCHELAGQTDGFNEQMGKLVDWFRGRYRRKAVVIHVSDECDMPGRRRAEVFPWYTRAVVLRQYQCAETETETLRILPLGWQSGEMRHIKSLLANETPGKEYSWGWAGTVKSDREEMIDTLSFEVENGFAFRATETDRMTTDEIFGLYSRSVFVPIGRGYSVLDCFRVYSALFAGAVPIVVGPSEEIRGTFKFLADGDDDPESSLPFVFAPSWKEAAEKVNTLLQEDQNLLSRKTRDWWYEYTEKLYEHVAAVVLNGSDMY